MIIEVDKFKEKISGYDPKRSADFHVQSAKMADIEFRKEIKKDLYKRIILMAGGTASGKTEYAQSYLTHKDQLVYDGTLKNFSGFEVKNQKIKRYAKHNPRIKVVYIIPLHWRDALEVFLSRKRKMKIEVFFETHIKSALTISRILAETKSNIEIYASNFNQNRNKMSYHRVTLGNRSKNALLFKEISDSLREQATSYGIELEF